MLVCLVLSMFIKFIKEGDLIKLKTRVLGVLEDPIRLYKKDFKTNMFPVSSASSIRVKDDNIWALFLGWKNEHIYGKQWAIVLYGRKIYLTSSRYINNF